MATLLDFRLRLANKLGLDNTNGSVEQGLIDSWVNEGVVELLLRTKLYTISSTMPLTFNVGDYTMPPQVLALNEMFMATSDGQSWPLERVVPDEILRLRRYAPSTGTPVRYYAVNGANLLMVYPSPTTGDSVTMYYVPRPTALSAPTDDPSNAATGGIPTQFHKAIEYYALWQGGDYQDDEASGNGNAYMQGFQGYVRDVRKWQYRTGGRRLGRAIPNRMARPPVPPTPSTDMRW